MLDSVPMTQAYGADLAYVHDAGFGGLARGAASVLLRELVRGGRERGLVVDLCCGSGLLSREVSCAGYGVLGVDISAAMVSLSGERVPGGRFLRGSMLSTEIPPCVAVAAIGECFNYLFDEGNSREALLALLGRIHAALEPGGVLLFDAAGPGRGSSWGHTLGDDWAVLVRSEEDEAGETLTRKITTFRRVGELYRRSEETHRLRLIPAQELQTQLQDLGFDVHMLRGYDGAELPPALTAFLARKPR